jgi:hypothetical protein
VGWKVWLVGVGRIQALPGQQGVYTSPYVMFVEVNVVMLEKRVHRSSKEKNPELTVASNGSICTLTLSPDIKAE